ncbi:hypothetical protein WMR99_004061 [Salmonella enterica]|uniref:Uncharacterized protein n=1 Tax=Salmonella enterica TaxID=28901 RepID=A0A744NAK5_SALER|nr:hypothetical protein [Salmonella enterica]EDO6298443.1 hypothetical protein [Salmonella enterica]EDV5340054.1 hypothetical protein [Salmonella enterica subsp. enterica serovar 4,12:i:-]EJA0744308.1 hypothetical protein [Salmonella enterica]HAF2739751.1 hypothetical protein [Salmonella enterica]
MAAFSYPATITPQTRHTRTTTPDHQRTDSDHESAITTRSDDNFLILRTTAGAQCFPRHACPLYGAVLMQLHQHSEAAPALASFTHDMTGKNMQFDAI